MLRDNKGDLFLTTYLMYKHSFPQTEGDLSQYNRYAYNWS